MKKRRRKRKKPAQSARPTTSMKPVKDEHGFGIFYIERPEDVERVRAYLANPTNAALVVIAHGLQKKGLSLPQPSKTRRVRVVRMQDLEALLESGHHLPRHWRK